MEVSVVIPYIRPGKIEFLKYLVNYHAGIKNIEIIAEEDSKRIGCPEMVKKLVSKTKYENVCFLGDDTYPIKNFLKYALEDMKTIGYGLVGFNDMTGRTLPTHWLASKKLLAELNGEFFHTGYTHCCCDVELMERCIEMGRYIYSKKAVVIHDHPILKGEKITDPDLKRVYSSEVYGKDQELLKKRRLKNWHI